jgi:hypothetical protein
MNGFLLIMFGGYYPAKRQRRKNPRGCTVSRSRGISIEFMPAGKSLVASGPREMACVFAA